MGHRYWYARGDFPASEMLPSPTASLAHVQCNDVEKPARSHRCASGAIGPLMRSLLAHPQFFQLFDTLVGGGFCVRFLTANHLRVQSGQRLLDVGGGNTAIQQGLPP